MKFKIITKYPASFSHSLSFSTTQLQSPLRLSLRKRIMLIFKPLPQQSTMALAVDLIRVGFVILGDRVIQWAIVAGVEYDVDLFLSGGDICSDLFVGVVVFGLVQSFLFLVLVYEIISIKGLHSCFLYWDSLGFILHLIPHPCFIHIFHIINCVWL